VRVVPQTSILRRPVETLRPTGAIVAPHSVRRLRVATDAVISGTPVDEAAREAGFARTADFLQLLEERSETHPPSRWLHSQLQLGAKVRELEAELARTKALVSDQQMALSRNRSQENRNPTDSP
jgi:hypothetical protein